MVDQIQTIILCGGLGTRLREETEYRPRDPWFRVEKRLPLAHHENLLHYGRTISFYRSDTKGT